MKGMETKDDWNIDWGPLPSCTQVRDLPVGCPLFASGRAIATNESLPFLLVPCLCVGRRESVENRGPSVQNVRRENGRPFTQMVIGASERNPSPGNRFPTRKMREKKRFPTSLFRESRGFQIVQQRNWVPLSKESRT